MEFWGTGPLTQLHQAARAGRAAPMAVLAVTLARIVASTPPSWRLPALVGGPASLNVFVSLVGASGAGKGAATAASDAALSIEAGLWAHEAHRAQSGTGEGVAHLFRRRPTTAETKTEADGPTIDPDGLVTIRDRVLLSVPELDLLLDQIGRPGWTIGPVLRSAYMAEPLGQANAAADRTIPVAGHSYRLCLIGGVQPARGARLLAERTGGLAQRLVLVDASDPDAPEVAPDHPGLLRWRAPEPPLQGILGVSPAIRAFIDNQRLRALRGESVVPPEYAGFPDLAAHVNLVRLKVAAAFALLHGRVEVDASDWERAGHLCVSSTAAQWAALIAAEHDEDRVMGEKLGRRAVTASVLQEAHQASVFDQRVADARTRVLELLAAAEGGTLGESALLKRFTPAKREAVRTAVEELVSERQVARVEASRNPGAKTLTLREQVTG